MATEPMNRVMRQLRRALLAQDDGRTDAQLLERFVACRDEAAFAALVRRHGPMVLGVCRRTAGHADDADDAFQAVFLVLARKAASIRAPARLGAWLYGVAYRTARKARAAADRIRGRERQVPTMPQPAVEPDDRWQEITPLLDQELSRLPDKYRIPIILCDLEGGPRKEVARRLGVPEGTLSSRLATGRRMLARRLGRFGLAVSGGALAAVLTQKACAAVPAALSAATIRAAFASATAAVAVSAKVAALTEGVIKAMLWTKLKIAVVCILAAGFLLAGAGTAALGPGQARATDDAKANKSKPAADDAKDAVWTLDFRFQVLRLLVQREAGEARKSIWFMIYRVANPTDQEHRFIPDFELVVDEKEVHHDQTSSPAFRDAIEPTEDPTGSLDLKTSVTIAADPLPPTKPGAAQKSVAGVAFWDDAPADCDHLCIYVYGLSNGWKVEGDSLLRKTLRLNFKRVGGEMRLDGSPQWQYRASKTAPADQVDELRRTVADLRKQLEKTQYAAAVTDSALLEKGQEIAALRDKLASAQIQVEALTDRCKALEQRSHEIESEKDKEKGKRDDKPSDAPRVEGVVTKVSDGLVSISIGTDAGVVRGTTLDVYRLDPPIYLGSLRIIEARPDESIGKPTRVTPGKDIKTGGKDIQIGDHVTNSILGK